MAKSRAKIRFQVAIDQSLKQAPQPIKREKKPGYKLPDEQNLALPILFDIWSRQKAETSSFRPEIEAPIPKAPRIKSFFDRRFSIKKVLNRRHSSASSSSSSIFPTGRRKYSTVSWGNLNMDFTSSSALRHSNPRKMSGISELPVQDLMAKTASKWRSHRRQTMADLGSSQVHALKFGFDSKLSSTLELSKNKFKSKLSR